MLNKRVRPTNSLFYLCHTATRPAYWLPRILATTVLS